MIVALSYCPKDQDQAFRLAEWIHELGRHNGHSVVIVRDSATDPHHDSEIRKHLTAAFDEVTEIVLPNDGINSWPISCNRQFAFACRHMEDTRVPYWLWLEVDAVPLRADWMDTIEIEYKSALAAGKFFLGDDVNVPNVERHCSGIAVYPGDMTAHAGLVYLGHDVAWDVACAAQIVPQMMTSKFISHAWKHPAFADWEQVEREIFAIKPECRLFHADKTGSLYHLLRARINSERWQSGNASDPTSPVSVGEAQVANVRGFESLPFQCDIFIKTYPPDFVWLRYCLRSIAKFAQGFRRVIVAIPTGTSDELHAHLIGHEENLLSLIQIECVNEHAPGYLWQQAVKASAHLYTDADYILHIDSDVILTTNVTPQTFFRNGKPYWLYAHYDKIDTPWKPITERFMGEPVEFEFMRALPKLVPRWLHEELNIFSLEKHRRPVADYIMDQPAHEYSEFNAMGALAYSRHNSEFEWIDTHANA